MLVMILLLILTLLSIFKKGDVTVNYWAANDIRNRLEKPFQDIRDGTTMWYFFRYAFGPIVFFNKTRDEAI